MSKKWSFKIPNPHAGGYTPKKVVDRHLMGKKPTDKNQMAPAESQPVRQHYKMAGGC